MPVPFFPASKHLTIELAEPVTILRGPPTDPATHVLRGEVELVLSKPIHACDVIVQLVGRSYMLWPEGLGSRGKVYHEKTIHEQNLILQTLPEDQSVMIPAGLNRWPFTFLLPNTMVETIEDEIAKVYYYVNATVHRNGLGTNIRCRRNIMLLRTLTSSDASLISYALPSPSIVVDRKFDACDATICIDKAIASSGTQFPISVILAPHLKHVHLESIAIVLTERRVYQLPEFNAYRKESHDYKLQLTSVTNLEDPSLALNGLVPCSDVPLTHLRRALAAKNAHIPLSNPFQHRFIFTLPNCLTLNHTTFFSQMKFNHNLRIHIELSVPDSSERVQIHLDTPITILDCRLKEEFATLPTYKEALSDPMVDAQNTLEKPGFFLCPCYLDFKKKSRQAGRQEWMMVRQNGGAPMQPPPPYSFSR
ncbi:hypothetical protein J3Q64DRAFT_1150682 [Phycomyces blakesleeanus]|uniref:Uncharacterized protein n=2 Tax=Phycomyces blakesleeanus TaxID=4837 RepID=A0A167PM34_PHYB8|nr:hypothetical protein PHYBLDRAFT_163318 [Phycomyces blakesleeanus NRRL 1555(-)]OAD78197.1 hypothetical protein PHYBLDRAFT_163318 [Phycomyces blakesleeanus NRRL 1555(-)]|eukprot:XP_018296237.1 hypothetical protein PHYBLDRAFT_163318 [Phycomyces blakesleeanus NRRL 1555(-)]